MIALLILLKRRFQRSFSRVRQHVLRWTRPTNCSCFARTLTDLTRAKAELIAENALLRQQLIILRRQMKRPTCSKTDRPLLLLLARAVRNWRQALFIVQPDTLLGWHRQAFRWFWRRRSQACASYYHNPLIMERRLSTMKLSICGRMAKVASTGVEGAHSSVLPAHLRVRLGMVLGGVTIPLAQQARGIRQNANIWQRLCCSCPYRRYEPQPGSGPDASQRGYGPQYGQRAQNQPNPND